MKHMLFLIIFGMLMTPACSHTGISSADLDTLEGTEWVLEDLGGRGVADRVQSTILFQSNDRIAAGAAAIAISAVFVQTAAASISVPSDRPAGSVPR